MKKMTAGAAITSLVLVGTAGSAALAKPGGLKPSKRAHVFRAQLGPVAVGPYAQVPQTRGRAHLLDGWKTDKLSIHVRGLQAGTTYDWHIHKAPASVKNPCAAPAASALAVPGWTFRPLVANPDGNANAHGRSLTFKADPTATYYVDVHLPGAAKAVVVCGVLKAAKGKKASNGAAPTGATTTGATTTGATTQPFVVSTPGGLPATGDGTTPAPPAGDGDDQGGDGTRPSGKGGRGRHKPGHPHGPKAPKRP